MRITKVACAGGCGRTITGLRARIMREAGIIYRCKTCAKRIRDTYPRGRRAR